METLEAKYQRINNTILERFNGISWVNYAMISAELKKRLESAKKRIAEEERNKTEAQTRTDELQSENQQLSLQLQLTQKKLEQMTESFEKASKQLTEQREISEYFRNETIRLEGELNQYQNNNPDKSHIP